MTREKKTLSISDIMQNVDESALITRSISDWRPILAKECQVYVFDDMYLAKRFDQINYRFCALEEAKEICIDNIYALLRYKYFTKITDKVDERIDKIVKNFTSNLKTTLCKVSFDNAAECNIMHLLPDSCVAFRNGVFDFKENRWFIKYDIIDLERISNKLYMYPDNIAIMWYFNFDFEPLPFSIMDISLEDMIDIYKDLTAKKGMRNFCFELMYNIAHDRDDSFSNERFTHLCEIMGYACLQSFSQYFVMLIGSGQNGKNSLFDGCFSNRIIPRPAANNLDEIEQDRFITGSLENKAQNIFLETSAKTYTESKMIKALTGSMYQTIQPKGVNKYSGIINCKFIFAGNDQDKIKFSDTTTGFRRRINMFEIFYHWDSKKTFLKRGDYYDTTFSDSLSELKDDISNTIAFIYFAMYGIKSTTRGFTSNFAFTKNDWNTSYFDTDVDLKSRIEAITPSMLVDYFNKNDRTKDEAKTAIFDIAKVRLPVSPTIRELGFDGVAGMLSMLGNEESCATYFSEHDVYICVRTLQSVLGGMQSSIAFSSELKKIYLLESFESIYANKAYVKINFTNGKLKIVR